MKKIIFACSIFFLDVNAMLCHDGYEKALQDKRISPISITDELSAINETDRVYNTVAINQEDKFNLILQISAIARRYNFTRVIDKNRTILLNDTQQRQDKVSFLIQLINSYCNSQNQIDPFIYANYREHICELILILSKTIKLTDLSEDQKEVLSKIIKTIAFFDKQ